LNVHVNTIGFAISRSRTLLRRILAEHAPDEARQQLAERVVKHLEQSGFDLDEEGRTLRKRTPLQPHWDAAGRLAPTGHPGAASARLGRSSTAWPRRPGRCGAPRPPDLAQLVRANGYCLRQHRSPAATTHPLRHLHYSLSRPGSPIDIQYR
jgi:hypothetical protein